MPEILAVIPQTYRWADGSLYKGVAHKTLKKLTLAQLYELGISGIRELFNKLGKENPDARWLTLYMQHLKAHHLHEFAHWENPYYADRGAEASQKPESNATITASSIPPAPPTSSLKAREVN